MSFSLVGDEDDDEALLRVTSGNGNTRNAVAVEYVEISKQSEKEYTVLMVVVAEGLPIESWNLAVRMVETCQTHVIGFSLGGPKRHGMKHV
jgi:hypothetical protein